MKLKTSKKFMLVAAIALLSGSMVVYAATLFTQTFPGQTFTTASLVAGTCGSTLQLSPDEGNNAGGFAGNSASLVFDCAPPPTCLACGSDLYAFTTQGPTSGTVTATPTFTVPTGWTLGVSTDVSGGCTGVLALTSGTPATLTGGSSFVYCLSTSSSSTFASFSITWSQ